MPASKVCKKSPAQRFLSACATAGLSKTAPEKAADGGADASADIDAYPGASLMDKLSAATAQHT